MWEGEGGASQGKTNTHRRMRSPLQISTDGGLLCWQTQRRAIQTQQPPPTQLFVCSRPALPSRPRKPASATGWPQVSNRQTNAGARHGAGGGVTTDGRTSDISGSGEGGGGRGLWCLAAVIAGFPTEQAIMEGSVNKWGDLLVWEAARCPRGYAGTDGLSGRMCRCSYRNRMVWAGWFGVGVGPLPPFPRGCVVVGDDVNTPPPAAAAVVAGQIRSVESGKMEWTGTGWTDGMGWGMHYIAVASQCLVWLAPYIHTSRTPNAWDGWWRRVLPNLVFSHLFSLSVFVCVLVRVRVWVDVL